MVNQSSDFPLEVVKAQLRHQLKITTKALDPIRQVNASKEACAELNLLSKQAHLVLSFASFGSEIDLWPLNLLLATGGRLVLPRMQDKELHLYHVKSMDDLELHPWGLKEPNPSQCALIQATSIEIALIPGLAFDLQTKYRLGFGKGYYDRLLAKAAIKQTWGIGFLEQAITHLPYTTHDIPLNKVYLF